MTDLSGLPQAFASAAGIDMERVLGVTQETIGDIDGNISVPAFHFKLMGALSYPDFVRAAKAMMGLLFASSDGWLCVTWQGDGGTHGGIRVSKAEIARL